MKNRKNKRMKSIRRMLIVSTFLCFCTSFYVAYYKLVLKDDWAGFFYDICLGLFTGLIAGIALYYLTVVIPLRNRAETEDENREEGTSSNQ